MKQYGKFIGYLSDKNLKMEKSTTKNGMPCELISGSIAVKIDDVTQYLNVYTKSKTNKGTDNPMFESIRCMYNNYNSLVDVKENRAIEASYIMVKATPNIGDWKDKEGQFHEAQLGFNVTSVERVDPNKNKARVILNLTGYINSIKDEFENGEETGRKIIDLIGIDYFGEAEPYKVYIEAEHADAICDAWSVGDTIQPVCTIKNHAISKASARTSLIGVQTVTTYERQITIINAYPPIDDEEKQIDATEIKKAIKARNIKIEALKNSVNNNKPVAATQPVNIVIDDDEECPF